MLSLQKGRADMYRRMRNKNKKNIFIVLAALLLFAGVMFLAKQKDAWQWIEEQWRPIKSWFEEVIEEDSSEVEEMEESSEISEESSGAEEEEGEDTQYVPEKSEEPADAESSRVLMESSVSVEESSEGSMPMEESESSVESDESIATDNWGVEDWN